MKITKVSPPHNIPKEHWKWAGIEAEEEKKNDLDVERLDELVRKIYHKKYGTYNHKGKFIPHEEIQEDKQQK
jgi:hypothetical protein